MVMKFITIVALPQAPHPICPIHNCSINGDSLSLIWAKASPNVTRYWIEIAADSLMSEAIIDSLYTDTVKTLLHCKNNTVFWWRLKAYNEAGWGDFCAPQRFKVEKVHVLPNQYALKKFALSRSRGTISYELPVKCNVRGQLFDVKGKLVKNIEHSNVLPGIYTDHITLKTLPMGNYFLKFRAGSFTRSFKIVILH